MRRPLALFAAVITVCASTARASEPLDLDLTLLGPPASRPWMTGDPTLTQAQADQLSADARARFAVLSSQLALALSSSLLQPAPTIGHSGFAFDFEVATTQVNHDVIGTATCCSGSTPAAPGAYPRDAWPTRTKTPTDLLVPSFHVRKALPWSVELGGRVLYLSQSSYFAAQFEAKVAVFEGYWNWPDVALMANYTKLLGVPNLNLSSSDWAVVASKRFGVNAVTSVTPYLAGRLLFVRSSTSYMVYVPDPATATQQDMVDNAAAFPSVTRRLYRTTLGLRLTSYATSLAAEATWYGGGSPEASDGYPAYTLQSSLGGAFKLGFEF
jgi:hypothetical protein